MTADYHREALLFKALGDENRLHILTLLTNGELCACKLLAALSITQPTLSHHMKILCDAGLVTPRREGKWTHYTLCATGKKQAQDALQCITEAEGKIQCGCSYKTRSWGCNG